MLHRTAAFRRIISHLFRGSAAVLQNNAAIMSVVGYFIPARFIPFCHCDGESKRVTIAHMKATTLPLKRSMNRLSCRFALLIRFGLACFALLPNARAVNPPPIGGYPGGNTAEGQSALLNLTTGTYNAGIGIFSLLDNATGNFNTGVGAGTLLSNTADENTATGAGALLNNTTGALNTAQGAFALFSNTTGGENTAHGFESLFSNVTGSDNTAIGDSALFSNTSGGDNTAIGYHALFQNSGDLNTATGWQALNSNTTGAANTANGLSALLNNTTGNFNTAIGERTLQSNISGSSNTAIGDLALLNATGDDNTATGAVALEFNTTGFGNTAIGNEALKNNTTGSFNTAIGVDAGLAATTGQFNVYIGAVGGEAGESNHTYIANIFGTSVSGGGTDVVTVDLTTGLLGHLNSSRRYKEDIKRMDKASEALYRLKPVTYRYKKDIDRTQSRAFGLVAEEVAEVNPDLVAHNAQGQPESVHYEMVNAMLLNEFLKEHRHVQQQDAIIARQQKQIEALTAGLQQVSAQLELAKSAPQTVLNNW